MDDGSENHRTQPLGPVSQDGPKESHSDPDRLITRVTESQSMETISSDLLSKGTSVGRYVILEILGEGGMSVVYRAFDPELDRHIALKFLQIVSKGGGSVAQQRTRLVREAQALAKISHPNIVAVYDVGMFQRKVFVAMELVQGKTLRQWLKASRRSRQEVLKVFYEAGCGLAAAHKAGVIHRDFKPDNVVVGDNGRIRVLDFGLARGAEHQNEPVVSETVSSPTDSALLFVPITLAGSVMGTPAYMSPEQHLGGVISDKTDQFAFCVSLFESLTGERPFRGRNSDELREQILSGQFEGLLSRSRLPVSIKRLLLRGMAINPEQRFDSMDALNAALSRIINVKRRRTLLIGFSAAILATAAVSLIRLGTVAKPCLGSERQLKNIWEPPIAAAVQTAFLQTQLPFATKTWEEVQRRLDQYTQRWQTLHREVCEATRVHGEQSEEVLDLRMACLTQRLEEVQALTRIFRKSEPAVVQRAVEAVASLTRLDSCSDIQALKARIPPPTDAHTRKRVNQIRAKLSGLKSLATAGQYQEGLESAILIADEAQKLNYRPVQAEAKFRLGQFQYRRGKLDRASQTLEEAVWSAEASGHDEMIADSLLEQIQLAIETEDFKSAEQIGRRADAVIHRLKNPPELRGALLIELARLAGLQARYDQSARFADSAVGILEPALGQDHPVVARAYQVLGSSQSAVGHNDEAIATLKKALSLEERILGPDHPTVASALLVLGNLYADEGKIADSEANMRRALEIWERAEGPDHPDVGQVLVNIGATLKNQQRYDEALHHFERAIGIFRKAYGPDHSMVAVVLQNLGEIALNTKQIDRARSLYEQALSIDEKAYGPNHPYLAYDLAGVGEVHLASARPAQAVAVLERALSLPSPDRTLVSLIRFALARALWDLGHRERAYHLAQQARAAFVEKPAAHKKELEEVEAWLTEHFK